VNLLLWREVRGQTWAIQSDWLHATLAGDWKTHVGTKPRPKTSGSVAIIPIHGPIAQRGSIFSEMFGGTSTEAFEAAFSRAVNSSRVSSIVLDVDSPGGTTSGVESAADRVFKSRGSKPIVAISNSENASAAYWISSQADSVVAAPGSNTGSIGAFRMHKDVSGALESDGVKMTLISKPQFKTEGNPFEPLSAEARSHHQEQVDESFDLFNRDVARGRGISTKQARSDFGEGRSFHPRQAKEMGLVDRVATLPDVLSSLGVGKGATVSQAESADITAELCAAWDLGVVVETPARSVDLARRRLDLLDKCRAI